MAAAAAAKMIATVTTQLPAAVLVVIAPKIPAELAALMEGQVWAPHAFATARADLGLFMPIATSL